MYVVSAFRPPNHQCTRHLRWLSSNLDNRECTSTSMRPHSGHDVKGDRQGQTGVCPRQLHRARVCFPNGNEFKNSGEVDSTCTLLIGGDPIALGGDASGVVPCSVLSMMSSDVRLSSSSQVLFRSSPPKKLSFLDFQEIFRRTFLTPPRAHRGGGFGGRRLPGPRTGVPHVFRSPHSLARQISRFSGFSGFLNFQIFGVF